MTKPPKKKMGGARPGAGRPKGKISAPSRKLTREIINRVSEDGKIQPLDILIECMRFHWDASLLATDKRDYDFKMLSMDKAARYAEMAAPYMHPKLQSTTVKGDADAPIPITFIDDVPDTRKKR